MRNLCNSNNKQATNTFADTLSVMNICINCTKIRDYAICVCIVSVSASANMQSKEGEDQSGFV